MTSTLTFKTTYRASVTNFTQLKAIAKIISLASGKRTKSTNMLSGKIQNYGTLTQVVHTIKTVIESAEN
jgi:hypothetical protein